MCYCGAVIPQAYIYKPEDDNIRSVGRPTQKLFVCWKVFELSSATTSGVSVYQGGSSRHFCVPKAC